MPLSAATDQTLARFVMFILLQFHVDRAHTGTKTHGTVNQACRTIALSSMQNLCLVILWF